MMIAAIQLDVPDASLDDVLDAINLIETVTEKHFQQWATEQRKAGRPEQELTWENCWG
jgi:hypothetical protein